MKRTFKLSAIHAAAVNRPAGYVDDVLSRGAVNGDTVTLTEDAYQSLADKYRGPASSGPGSQLKALLAKFGIHASPTCGCNAMARKMDAWGPDESLNHIEEIVDVMEETANKRGLPFLRSAARLLVRRAISKSRAMISKGSQ